MYPMMPPRVSVHEIGRSVRSLSFWGAGTGGGLLALLAFVVASTYIVFTRGEAISGPSDGSMFHGGEAVFAWLIGNLAAGFFIVVLGVATLVLDISVLVKLSRLRGYGVRVETLRPLNVAVVTGMGVVSTPVGVLLMFIPSIAFGPGETTNTVLLVLAGLMFLAPLAGRIAQVLCARRLSGTLEPEGPLPGYPQPTPRPPQN